MKTVDKEISRIRSQLLVVVPTHCQPFSSINTSIYFSSFLINSHTSTHIHTHRHTKLLPYQIHKISSNSHRRFEFHSFIQQSRQDEHEPHKGPDSGDIRTRSLEIFARAVQPRARGAKLFKSCDLRDDPVRRTPGHWRPRSLGGLGVGRKHGRGY